MTDPVQVAYNAIEDAMTPAAYDSHHGGYWLSDLPPDLLAQRIVTALRDHLTSEDAA